MTNEIKTIEKALNQICSHKLFVNAPALVELLKYLVEKSIIEEQLTEIKIGTELYGINYSKNMSNSTVRSYIHKLRNKLEAYYLESDTDAPIVFIIEKGRYQVSFIPAHQCKNQSAEQTKTVNIPVKYIKCLIGVLFIGVLLVLGSRIMNSKSSSLWDQYFAEGANNMLVISDQFMIFGKVWDDRMYGVTYTKINNYTEFIEYTQNNPDVVIKPADYTMMSKMAPHTVKTLSWWFYENESDFTLQQESKLKYEELQNNNILFVGQYKTMNLSKSIFLKDSKVFSTYQDGFKHVKDSVETIYNTTFNKNKTIEYAMVSFTTLSQGKSMLYFVSNNDIGVIATLRKFTNRSWLHNFSQQLPSESTHFNALFKVNGLHRNDVSCELVELEILDY